MNSWINAPSNPEEYLGFVYLIHNETNNKSYIGQKKFWFTKTLPPLKGNKRKRKKLVESDWKDYTGSNEKLNTDIQNGHIITKTIIRLCHSKFEMNYYELKEQMDREVLFNENYYNGIINVRISRPDKKLLEEWNRTKYT
jgi:hypothetical protein